MERLKPLIKKDKDDLKDALITLAITGIQLWIFVGLFSC